MKKGMELFKKIKNAVLPVTLFFIWIMITVFNSMLFIINTVAFAITSDASFTTQVLENAVLISIGIVGIVNHLKNLKYEEEYGIEQVRSVYCER